MRTRHLAAKYEQSPSILSNREPICSDSPRHYHRQLHEACLTRRVVDTLRSFAVIPGFCPENVGHESLRIAIIQREPTGLNLYHDAVSGEENVVRRGQIEAIEQRLVGSEGFCCLQALAIAAAEDVGGNH